MNDDVIVQMPCRIIDDAPSEAFFCVGFRKFSCVYSSRRFELYLIAVHVIFSYVPIFTTAHHEIQCFPTLFEQEVSKTYEIILAELSSFFTLSTK